MEKNNMIELSLLKTLSNKEYFNTYRRFIDPDTLSIESITLLKAYEKYFENHDKMDMSDFKTFFLTTLNPNLDPNRAKEFANIIENINSQATDQQVEVIVRGFQQQEFYFKLHDLLDKNIESEQIETQIKQFNENIKLQQVDDYFNKNMDIKEALEVTNRNNGLQWRCESLREHFTGGLIKGDFVIVAGYTDSGKTSFLASEMSYMASQLEEGYILWLNNEGAWQRILPRCYSAALNKTGQELRLEQDFGVSNYQELMKGNKDRIYIMDIQGKHIKDIEKILKINPPRVIIFDMLDHLRGFEKHMSSESGSHERYGKLYHWALSIANEYCPVIATSQLNRNGFREKENGIKGNMWPNITDLMGSGVAKQSAATAIIMIGMMEGEDNVRYLSTPKFKINERKHWQKQVRFDPTRSRFI